MKLVNMKWPLFILVIWMGQTAFGQLPTRSPMVDSLKKLDAAGLDLSKTIDSLKNASEDAIYQAVYFYRENGQKEKADHLVQAIGNLYPYGRTKAMELLRNLAYAKSIDEVESKIQVFQEKFDPSLLDDAYFNGIVGLCRLNEGASLLTSYLEKINKPIYRLSASLNTARFLELNQPDMLEEFLNLQQAWRQSNLTETECRSPRFANFIQDLELIKARLLLNKGRGTEALAEAKKAISRPSSATQEELIFYTDLLFQQNQYSDFFEIADKIVKSKKGTIRMREQLATSYRKLFEGDGEEYLRKIDRVNGENLDSLILKYAVTRQMPDFVLSDSKGNPVRISDFKGKTLVLDFWATWCGPCVKSLPAMQQAVDLYKTDNEVVFLFIHTWGKGNDLEEASKFFEQHQYRMNLFIDSRNADGSYAGATALKVKGIPQKMVVDKQGIIRFASSGFNSGEYQTVVELKAMIEKAKRF